MGKYKVFIYTVSNDYFITECGGVVGFLVFSGVFPQALHDLRDQGVPFPRLLTSSRSQMTFL